MSSSGETNEVEAGKSDAPPATPATDGLVIIISRAAADKRGQSQGQDHRQAGQKSAVNLAMRGSTSPTRKIASFQFPLYPYP